MNKQSKGSSTGKRANRLQNLGQSSSTEGLRPTVGSNNMNNIRNNEENNNMFGYSASSNINANNGLMTNNNQNNNNINTNCLSNDLNNLYSNNINMNNRLNNNSNINNNNNNVNNSNWNNASSNINASYYGQGNNAFLNSVNPNSMNVETSCDMSQHQYQLQAKMKQQLRQSNNIDAEMSETTLPSSVNSKPSFRGTAPTNNYSLASSNNMNNRNFSNNINSVSMSNNVNNINNGTINNNNGNMNNNNNINNNVTSNVNNHQQVAATNSNIINPNQRQQFQQIQQLSSWSSRPAVALKLSSVDTYKLVYMSNRQYLRQQQTEVLNQIRNNLIRKETGESQIVLTIFDDELYNSGNFLKNNNSVIAPMYDNSYIINSYTQNPQIILNNSLLKEGDEIIQARNFQNRIMQEPRNVMELLESNKSINANSSVEEIDDFLSKKLQQQADSVIRVSKANFDEETGYLKVRVGEKLANRYIAKRALGQGTFGRVLLADDEVTKTEVAIKVSRSDEIFEKRCIEEIKVLATLNLKVGNMVPKLIDNFYHNGHFCIVTEALGSNLYQILKSGNFEGLPLNEVRKYAYEMLTFLQELRRKDIQLIHADLKPENVLLINKPYNDYTARESIKLIDFGAATYAKGNHFTYIQSRFYRAPEIVLAKPDYDFQIDVWSLGAVLAELHTGKPLFQAKSSVKLLLSMCEILGIPPDPLVADVVIPKQNEDINSNNPTQRNENENEGQNDNQNNNTKNNTTDNANANEESEEYNENSEKEGDNANENENMQKNEEKQDNSLADNKKNKELGETSKRYHNRSKSMPADFMKKARSYEEDSQKDLPFNQSNDNKEYNQNEKQMAEEINKNSNGNSTGQKKRETTIYAKIRRTDLFMDKNKSTNKKIREFAEPYSKFMFTDTVIDTLYTSIKNNELYTNVNGNDDEQEAKQNADSSNDQSNTILKAPAEWIENELPKYNFRQNHIQFQTEFTASDEVPNEYIISRSSVKSLTQKEESEFMRYQNDFSNAARIAAGCQPKQSKFDVIVRKPQEKNIVLNIYSTEMLTNRLINHRYFKKPNHSEDDYLYFIQLIAGLLTYDPQKRLTPDLALGLPFFMKYME